jgi:signal transduction histidine kinase
MHARDTKNVNLDTRLKLMFVLLVGLIVAGNGLLLWQFHSGQLQTKRVTRVSEQMAAVLRLQGTLLSFHQRLGELAQLKDVQGLKNESDAGQHLVIDQLQQLKAILTPLPAGNQTDPLLLPTLDAIEVALPAQLDSITGLASLGDWNAVNFRIGERLNPFEIEASTLVKIVDQHFVTEISQSQSNMKTVQNKILILVPLTAIYTFAIATMFAWVIARRILELRFEERVSERTRIARDLHDTLLQSFHGLLLSFRAVYDLLPARPVEAKQGLENAIDEASEAITEGRDAVQGLRSSAAESNDIAEAIRAVGEELAAQGNDLPSPAFRVQVEGASQRLHPILRDEIYRIASEALRNAFRHAQARRIEVEIHYDYNKFRLRVRDDGKGIDSRLLGKDAPRRHFGLHGMRERAQLSGGKLVVWTQIDSGTEIEMTVPAATAYAAPNHRSRWSARFSQTTTAEGRSKAL